MKALKMTKAKCVIFLMGVLLLPSMCYSGKLILLGNRCITITDYTHYVAAGESVDFASYANTTKPSPPMPAKLLYSDKNNDEYHLIWEGMSDEYHLDFRCPSANDFKLEVQKPDGTMMTEISDPYQGSDGHIFIIGEQDIAYIKRPTFSGYIQNFFSHLWHDWLNLSF